MKHYQTVSRNRSRSLSLLLMLASWLILSAAYAEEHPRFLDRYTSQIRGGKQVVTIHFMQQLQYLSHTPENEAATLNIRLRGLNTGLQVLAGQVSGAGLERLPIASQDVPLAAIRTSGSLETDPGIVLTFSRPVAFEIKPGPNTRSMEIILATADNQSQPVAMDNQADMALPALRTGSDEMLNKLLLEARAAETAGKPRRAIAIYDKLIVSGIDPYRQQALLFSGVVREQQGQYAQARAQYQRYLEDYPDSVEAPQVKRRLAKVIAGVGRSDKAGAGDADTAGQQDYQWNYFGAFDQFYRQDSGSSDHTDHETYRSSLLTSTNLNLQGQGENLRLRGRFSGSYDYSFLDDRDSVSRVSYMFIELADMSGRHEGTIGRQRLSSSGVLGYFDGLHYQFRANEQYALRYVMGSPMLSSQEGVDTDRLFYGLAADYHAPNDKWFLSLYGLNQQVDGYTDRRAIGTEARLHGEKHSLYSLLDYDLYFDELNIFYLFGNWQWQQGSAASLTLDYRRSPLLSLRNALQGQTLESIDELADTFPTDDLKQLALNNSFLYKSAYLSLSHQLNPAWQTALDAGIYQLSDTERSSDELVFDGSDEWYLSLQFTGNSLFKDGDMLSTSLRYADGNNADTTSLAIRGRIPLSDQWQIGPRIRFDWRERDDNADQRRIVPSLFVRYRMDRKTSIELDLGADISHYSKWQELGDTDDRFYYFNLGYRRDF